MPARDTYHDAVVKALTADGWTITHDPLPLVYGDQDLYVDLGAERGAIAAERGSQRIAVEIKSFLSRSAVEDFQMDKLTRYREIVKHIVLNAKDEMKAGGLKLGSNQFHQSAAKD